MTGKRKQESGFQKRKTKERKEQLEAAMAGSMDRYVKPKTNFVANTADHVLHEVVPTAGIVNENVNNGSDDGVLNHNLNDDSVLNDNVVDDGVLNENANDDNMIDDGVLYEHVIDDDILNENVTKDDDDIYDPGNWKEYMSQGEKDLLIERGPIRVSGVNYPIDNKRSFGDSNYTRILGNGEKHDRKWLVYSCKKNKVFCFCCVLFKKGVSSPLTSAGEGYNDWKNIYQRLSQHERSCEHIDSVKAWIEAETRLKKKVTIDVRLQNAIEKERRYWEEIMKRVISIVKGLATSNLAFRGSKEKIDDDNSGNFLKIVRIVAEFDPILKEHLRRIRSKEIRVHYLGHNIQNELILLLAAEVKSTILQTVKEAKYFSVILDCTPDISHEEQMTLVLRCINTATAPIRVEEYFVEFLKVVETTGEALFNELKCTLGVLQLDLNDVRGQGYDNGSNMKGHNKAKNFFGLIQRVYNFFSGSTKRWDVLAQYVKGRNGEGLTLKQWSDTRWESRLASVKAMRFQAPQIRKALLHIIGHNFDATSISEADALANFGLKKLDFLIGMVIWFDILNKVNSVSKLLQQKDMDVDVAISLLKGLISFFEEYNEYGFGKAKEEAKKIAIEMDVDFNFKESRIRKKKKFFYEIADDEPRECAEDSLRVTYFIPIVDHALSSLRTRFDQFTKYEEIFGFLFKLSKLKSASNESLKCSCVALETFMQHGDNRDVDAEELFSELQLLRRSLPDGTTKAIEVLEYIKKTQLCFPNAWIAYRVLLTIRVTVATAERSFSKLKLIKNYLRSSMSQDRLSGLAMLSIEKKVLDKLDCGPLISKFASQKARKVKF